MPDFHQLEPASNRCLTEEHPQQVCAGCGGQIQDRFFLQAADSVWHARCLCCAACKVSLEGAQSCFSKNGFIYCKEDYFRLYGSKSCARCGLNIESSELVMRVRSLVYHLSCFACASCNRVLATGEYFGMRDNIIYCQEDYDIIQRNTMALCTLYAQQNAVRVPTFYNGVGAIQKGRPRKKRVEQSHDTALFGVGVDDYERGTDEYSLNSPPRQKRMRTSFKHHQLRTMKAYFGLNHNPDAKDLKQLAEKTGLSKRVLQVWFQNARAKYRRSLLRQEQSQSGQSGDADSKTDAADNSAAEEDADRERRSPALSDVSSTGSLMDLNSHPDSDSAEESSIRIRGAAAALYADDSCS